MKGVVVRRGGGRIHRDERYGTLFEAAGARTGLASLGGAYAVVDAGRTSPRHFHRRTEEVYAIVAGEGVIHLDGREEPVAAGDCVSIPPRVVHAIGAGPAAPLEMWVFTYPLYDESDDEETDGGAPAAD